MTTMNLPPPPQKRRIAVVHDWLVAQRGGESVLEAILDWVPEAEVFTLFYDPKKVSERIRRSRVRAFWKGDSTRFPLKHYRALLPIYNKLYDRFPTAKYDLVLSSSHCLAHFVPQPKRGLHLNYVFAPMRYVWDQHEQYLGGGWLQDWVLKRNQKRLQGLDLSAARRVDHHAADSHHIAAKVQQFWGRTAEVIHPFVRLDQFPFSEVQRVGNVPYFLVVSALVPYKRIDRAILGAHQSGKRLVIVGDGPERPKLERFVSELSSRDGFRVEFKGWRPTPEVAKLYREAQAFLFPGTEDFGITPLEAQACGTPVIAYNEGGALETILQNETGVFFSGETEEERVENLARVMRRWNTADWNPVACRELAEQFSRERFQQNYVDWALSKWNDASF